MAVGRIAIIGGGPAGLMAAEAAAVAGAEVTVFEAMPTMGRKLLMAGKSGLNITHSDDPERFTTRFGAARERLLPALEGFPAAALREWCTALGIETFIGSSGRVFPTAMKASPLLRAWLARLARQGIVMHTRHRWLGLEGDRLVFDTPGGRRIQRFDAAVLALGGASWPRLGSDASWVPWLEQAGVAVRPFRPANCGFDVQWSEVFSSRFAGEPVKAVIASRGGQSLPGEFVVTSWGVEGSLLYAHSAALRDLWEQEGATILTLDLVPGRSLDRLTEDLARQPARASFANRLRKGAGLAGVKLGLLRETTADAARMDAADLARRIKALPLRLERPRPIERAISSAGGIAWDSVDEHLMLKAVPGVFVAGEMLDWEAPTGGYLLTACFATGRAAGKAAADHISRS